MSQTGHGHRTHDPPLLHLALAGLTLVVLLIGGRAQFSTWGSVQVRLVATYALAAIVLHGASRYVDPGLWLRGVAWLVLAGGVIHSGVLLRPEVLGPLAAVAALDLVIHRSQVTAEIVEIGNLARVIAGVTTLAALVLVGALILLASDPLILARLNATVLVAWGIVVTFSMRPGVRDIPTLLAGAGAFSVTFLLLTAPVLPFGPLLAYWAIIGSVALAVVTGAFTTTEDVLDDDVHLHRQAIRSLPDPVIHGTREQVRQYLSTGTGSRQLSRRIETALDRQEDGRLLPALAEAQARGSHPSRKDRAAALAELLDIDQLPTDPEAHT